MPTASDFIQLLSGDTRAEFENQNYTLGGVVQNAKFGNGGASTTECVVKSPPPAREATLNLSVSNVTGNSPPMIAGILIRSVEPGLFAPPSASGTSDGTPSTLSVQVVNGASVSHNITGVSFSGPNAGDFGNGTTLPLTVPALGSANVTVNVNPAAGGVRTATLNLTTTDPAVPTLNVALSVNVLDPIVSIGSTLDFGNSPTLPAPVSDVIFVDNDGGSTNLTVSSPVLTGPGASRSASPRSPHRSSRVVSTRSRSLSIRRFPAITPPHCSLRPMIPSPRPHPCNSRAS